MQYKNLTPGQIQTLRQNGCCADDWNLVKVAEGFDPAYVQRSCFSGEIRLGAFRKPLAVRERDKVAHRHTGNNLISVSATLADLDLGLVKQSVLAALIHILRAALIQDKGFP